MSKVTGLGLCECGDSECPECDGCCKNDFTVRLYHVDFYDYTGTLFCDACAFDAKKTGIFA